jgi:hypothetical protein
MPSVPALEPRARTERVRPNAAASGSIMPTTPVPSRLPGDSASGALLPSSGLVGLWRRAGHRAPSWRRTNLTPPVPSRTGSKLA